MQSDASILSELDRRRRELGLSVEQLSERSGVSRPTVQRILSGRHSSPSFSNILAIAECLGLSLRFDSREAPQKLKHDQAHRKAKQLVSLVQGISGLEGQAVDRETVESMVEQTIHELLAGSNRKLWSDS